MAQYPTHLEAGVPEEDNRRLFEFNIGGREYNIRVNVPDNCSICHAFQQVKVIHSSLYSNDNKTRYLFYVIYGCGKCARPFTGVYSVPRPSENDSLNAVILRGDKPYYEANGELLYYTPISPEELYFSDAIRNISPYYIDVYTQAHIAESHGLTDIAGMGYRKALECLINDYIINSLEKTKEEILAVNTLGNRIEKYVDDEDIKATAKACAWLGNDHAHYFRKYDQYDIDFLVALLDTTESWIDKKDTTRRAHELLRMANKAKGK